MPELPSFINYSNFFSVFLPGYVAVTLYLALFSPQLLFDREQSLSFDLFAAVVFVIAGPTIGAVLGQLHGQLVSVSFMAYNRLRRLIKRIRKGTHYVSSTGMTGSYYVMSKETEDERASLGAAGSNYQFCISTFLALVLVASFHLANGAAFDIKVHLPIYILALILLMNGIYIQIFELFPFSMYLYRKYDPVARRRFSERRVKRKLKNADSEVIEDLPKDITEVYFQEEMDAASKELENVLKLRLAKGEITLSQYEELRKNLDLH